MTNLDYLLSHILCFFLCFRLRVNSETTAGTIMNNASADMKTRVHVGVVLDLSSPVGSVANACIPMAISDFYATHPNFTTRLFLHPRNSDDVLGSAFTAQDLINKEKVDAILEAQRTMQARFVMAVGEKAQVPVVSFSATSPSLSTTQNRFFIRTALNDNTQAKAIATLVQAYGWHGVILVYEDTEYGSGLIPYLADEFQQLDIRVTSRFAVSPSSSRLRILKMLNKVMAMQTKVILVHMTSSLGSKLFLLAKEANMISEGYAWIITDGLSSLLDPMGAKVLGSMQGVMGIRPYVPQSESLESFKRKWRWKVHPNSTKLNIFGLWAYDSVWALAMAVEKVIVNSSSSVFELNYSKNESHDQFPNIRVSKTGKLIRNTLLTTSFKGLSGDFNLVKGQLQSLAFEIINVVDNKESAIGYWTPEYGLTEELGKPGKARNSTSTFEPLKPPIWPGNTNVIPKGWSIPVNGKKLRVGVPVKPGFEAYIKVEQDPVTNATKVTGFCYEIFLLALAALPFAVPHKVIPFKIDPGKSYNELIHQVKLQNFDAAVGDITILADRSQNVDFTLPYLQSHVSMIVKIKDDERKNMWIFLKPLSWQLWLTTGIFFICTGFVVWVLEHRINNDFRGPPQQQVGTVFWFSFSILVFAHREKIINNLSKLVLIIWIFVVLILTQSYTASLASMLTVRSLQPAVVDVSDLMKSGDFVGYETGSFVKDYLLKQIGFDESRLKTYGTPEEFDEALSKGSQNGGVTAIFGAQHCVDLFLAKYSDKYMTAGPTYKTTGLGFAFQQGSPLVPYISRAILTVTEDKRNMDALSQKCLSPTQLNAGDQDDQRTTAISPGSLTLYGFGGLFIITGVATVTSFIIYILMFSWSHWPRIDSEQPDSSVWSKVTELVKRFDIQSPDSTVNTVRDDVNATGSPEIRIQELSEDAENIPATSSRSSSDEDDREITVVDDSGIRCRRSNDSQVAS